MAYKIAGFFSEMQYYLSPRDRRAVKNNLRIILQSDKDLSGKAREVFRNFGKYLVDFFRMQKILNEEYIRKNVRISGMERVDEILAKGRGGIMITAHLGNWEMGGPILGLLKSPLFVIALPHKERPVNDLFNAQRAAWRITIVPTNIAVRKCIEALKNNQLVALAADRDFTAHGEVLDFLGKKALIPKGAAIFSIKTGAPILPAFLVRQPDETFHLFFEEPIYPPVITQKEIDRDTLLTVMEKYKTVLENKIKEYPTQWLMFREFWVS
jgi:KDO2-lipid IV(A) lauroyltransferase